MVWCRVVCGHGMLRLSIWGLMVWVIVGSVILGSEVRMENGRPELLG